MNPKEYLKNMGACNQAIDYASGFSSIQDAWDACDRPDWMIWFIKKTEPQVISSVWDSISAIRSSSSEMVRASIETIRSLRSAQCDQIRIVFPIINQTNQP